MKSLILICLLLNTIASPTVVEGVETSSTGSIRIKISGLKNKDGQLGILIFTNKEGFPSQWQKASKQILIPVSGDKLEYTFTDLPYGRYAVSVMHDENKNKKLDTNFLGIPKEGYGVSNNATGTMGPPKFEDASFTLDKNTITTEINVNY
jgi:uncharacterized protein (DUF2141 family)